MRELIFFTAAIFAITAIFFPEKIIAFQIGWSFCKLLNQGDLVGAINCVLSR